MPQKTIISPHPVPVPDLPDDLDAFPVYRVKTAEDDGREISSKLLRLSIRAAFPQRADGWYDALADLDRRSREWLLKAGAGRAKTIQQRFGSQTIRLLYQWSASGITTFEVEVPPAHDSPHGPLVSWQLTSPVQDYARRIADESQARRAELAREADHLATELSRYPDCELLTDILTAPRSTSYVEHTITVARDYLARPPAWNGEPHSGSAATWELLTRLGRGKEKDYDKEPVPIDGGAQGAVLCAVHKITGVRVAFKRLRIRDENFRARMRREIEAGQRFGRHPHVMPVLDADPEACWFTMPIADGTASSRAGELQDTQALRILIEAVCDALRQPHVEGFIHRDIKPANLLLLEGRWTVGDWGLLRRPRGETSDPHRTRSGTGFGTEGFAAPELSDSAHLATAAADIFSLGQVIGALVTGQRPQANIPLLPPDGPWRTIVDAATRMSPADRPQDVDEFRLLLNKHLP